MIKHILLFRFNEGVSSEVQDDAVNRLRQLEELCPTIGRWTVGINFADSPSAHALVEIGDFASQEDLEAYKQHPSHRAFSDFIRPLATWALADIEVEDPIPASYDELRNNALNTALTLIEKRSDPLHHENALETRRRMQGMGFPVDDSDFMSAALIGALTVYQKAEQQAFMELDQGSGVLSEATRTSGAMAENGVIELGILLQNILGEKSEP